MNDNLIKLRKIQIDSNDISNEYNCAGLENIDNTIRIYKSSPQGATLQLRSYGKATFEEEPQRIITTARYLNVDTLDQIITMLQAVRKEIVKC